MPIFMSLDGLDIKGESVVKLVGKDFAGKQIEVNSFSIGAGGSVARDRHGKVDKTAPAVSEVVVTKATDAASTSLLEACCLSTDLAKVTIVFTKGGSDPQTANVPFLVYELHNAFLTGFSQSSGGDRPTESISINFGMMKVTYNPTSDEQKQGVKDPIVFGWDLTKAIKA